ncbi:MAG: asparagine synthase-related protein, partial [Candidatus Paceibacterota bacterium]
LRPHHNRKLNFEIINTEELLKVSANISYFPDYPNSLSSLPYLKVMQAKGYKILLDGFGGDQLFNLWKAKKIPTNFNRLKSIILNDYQWRRVFRRHVFPWLEKNLECQFLSHLNRHTEIYPQTKSLDQLAMLQQLFSADFSEYLESACLIAKAHNIYRSHPFLRKDLITLALNLKVQDRTHKNYLKSHLQNSLGSRWKGSKKADFSETFQAYCLQLDYQELHAQALNRFKDWINPESFSQIQHLTNQTSKQLLVNWNLIGLLITEGKKV